MKNMKMEHLRKDERQYFQKKPTQLEMIFYSQSKCPEKYNLFVFC